ncbi:hypothetical protein E2C01_032854 [Portunus trituberculatus]|uniref:Uncharacterized protein n=1 Tax=Portunus trituberculatus TaxID=210409 RepID=A0A5B7EYJ7_PORTR|nr:hypothetical protein [Portunus trituberculatus]
MIMKKGIGRACVHVLLTNRLLNMTSNQLRERAAKGEPGNEESWRDIYIRRVPLLVSPVLFFICYFFFRHSNHKNT